MSKAYYKMRDDSFGNFWWELHSGNGSEIARSVKLYDSTNECIEAINRFEEIVKGKPRCILPKE